MKTFVDAAVFVRLADSAPSSAAMREAAAWFLSRPDRELVTTPLVLGQVYAAMTARAGDRRSSAFRAADAKARALLNDALPLASVPFDAHALQKALEVLAKREMAFWDATNWGAAIAANCDEYASFDRPGLPERVGTVRFVDPLELWTAAGRPAYDAP